MNENNNKDGYIKVEYTYKFWEPDKGFEEAQAVVYDKANQGKFQPANVEQIKKQYSKDEDLDPKTIRYAFRDDQMVGYIQARIRKNSQEVHLSFPWALPETPVDVQDKLFNEMIDYIQNTEDYASYKIRVNAFANSEENLEFLKKRGFVEKNAWKTLLIPLQAIAKANYNEQYTTKIGSKDDLPLVANLIKEDGRYTAQFPDDESIQKYLTESVLATGHLVLVYEGDELITTGAPLIFKPPQEDEERIILRFSAFKDPKNQEPLIPLMIEVAKECLKTNYGQDKPFLAYVDDMDSPQAHRDFLGQFSPIKSDIFMYYFYLKK